MNIVSAPSLLIKHIACLAVTRFLRTNPGHSCLHAELFIRLSLPP